MKLLSRVVRRAELAVPAAGGQVSHTVRLPDGDYSLAWELVPERVTLGGPASRPLRGEQALHLSEDATVVLPLGR